ncbi:MAG: FecR domain-containing protein [Acidobacteria bacterium]|nr:FecR domain-containing protein [Acidobacteriota bacterium]
MTKFISRLAIFAGLAVFGASLAFSQGINAATNKFVISAHAGGISYTEGTVAVARKVGKSGVLLRGDEVFVGDRVSTGNDGRAEVLLNPGSYLRLGENSAFEFVTTDLEDLRLRLDRGSAILEVYASRDFRVDVLTPHGKVRLAETGVYRVDVDKNSTAVAVWEGKALMGRGGETVVKEDRKGILANGTVSITKFDHDKDALEAWSKSRSKDLAKATANLKRRAVRDDLRNSLYNTAFNAYNSFGLWVFDPFLNGYCFLPFGYGWASPYGYGFGNYIGYYYPYNYPWWNYPWYPGYPSGGSHGNPSGGGSNPPQNQPTPIVSAGNREPVPPFVRMNGGGRGIQNSGDLPETPTYTPPRPIYIPPPANTGSRSNNGAKPQ